MMLPTKDTSSSATSDLPILVGIIGATSEVTNHLNTLLASNVAILPLAGELLAEETIGSCDGLIGLLDGDLGLSPELINSWAIASDYELPRLILAQHTVTGRADFDEILALSELVLNEDIAIRYFPIVDDEQQNYVGLLDVLTQEIVLPSGEVSAADDEHQNLTQDDRNELIELLSHQDLTGELLENQQKGFPVSLPKLRSLWDETNPMTVLPIDQWVSDSQIKSWLAKIPPRWIPDVFEAGVGKYISDCQDTVGIGIGLGVARLWQNNSVEKLVLINESDEEIDLDVPTGNVIYLDSRIRRDDIIRPKHSNYLVRSPRL